MAEKKNFTAPFRGEFVGLAADGSSLIFATKHDEGQPTAVFVIDAGTGKSTDVALDCGATAQLLVGGDLWVAGTDRKLRQGKVGKKLAVVGDAFDADVVAMTSCDGGIAAVAGDTLAIVDAKGKRAELELGEPGRCVAADPSGKWLVVGTRRGHLCVFGKEGKTFAEVSRTRVHDGEVTALAFAPDELRVYSAGTDKRLLVSFVRGSLDTEDRGGSNMHDGEVRAILMGPDFVTADGTQQRFYTAGLDGVVKAWPRGRTGSQRPAAFDQGVTRTQDLALVEIDGKPQLATAGLDGTLRVFSFDEDGKLAEHVATIAGAYTMAEQGLASQKPKDREAALADLASYADLRSIKLIAAHVQQSESDHKVQVKGVELLAKVDHAKTASSLAALFGHPTSDVRVAAFKGLRAIEGEDDLDVLKKATTSGQEDLGLHAVDAAVGIGTDAAARLIRDALDHGQLLVRLAALSGLEKHYGDAPQGTLLGLKAGQADVRRAALGRVLARGIVTAPEIAAQLRRMWDDSDDRVRLWAFVAATHRSDNLVKALRAADEDYHRQLFELEQLGKPESKKSKAPPAAKAFDAKKLNEGDFRPLLEAMGSRSIDVSLRGARCLAALGDSRAFGTLLQLSRDANASARVGVCKSLAVLGDPRSTKRVRAMLHDGDDQVRAAAFSALTDLESDSPATAARAGLAAGAADVRERALALLVKTAKANKKSGQPEMLRLFELALNDSEAALRQEAFKSAFNLKISGDGTDTLRFILRSSFADVRREVLQEAKAKPKDADYRALLCEIVDDADQAVRLDAFQFGIDKWPSKHHPELFGAALKSRHISQRTFAVQKLSQQQDDGLRAMLLDALDDDEVAVRLEAVRALIRAENRARLAGALKSEHLDVRVEAASALATLGDARSLPTLREVVAGYHALLNSKANADDIEAYKPRLQTALTGMSQLGDPSAIDAVVSLLDGDPSVANGAAAVLPSIAAPQNLEQLHKLSVHALDTVKLYAALGLAYCGDPSRAGLVFGKTSASIELFAAFTLREDSRERFINFVDSNDDRVRNIALALVLSLELTEHTAGGAPERCLSLLSANNPFVRLSAAEALEHYPNQPAFYKWVYAMLNGLKSPADGWKAEPRQLLALSRALALGEPRVAVRAAQVAAQLTEPKSDNFDRQFQLFEERHEALLADLEKQANKRKAEPLSERFAQAWRRVKAKAKSLATEPENFEEALQSLAFGAYTGLCREQSHPQAASLRGAAVAGLQRLAVTSDALRADAISVIMLALGDPTETVRGRAFEALIALDAPRGMLANEALSTGHADMGLRGLELLAEQGGGDDLLRQILVDSTNGLEDQAAKLLTDRIGEVEVYRLGLGAASERFRMGSVTWLASMCLTNESALKALISALKSDEDAVRFAAARELAARQKVEAFDVLVELLASEGPTEQAQAATALKQLRDPRGAAVLVARVRDDEDGTAKANTLLTAAATFGEVGIVPDLMRFIDEDLARADAFEALTELIGYKQYEYKDDAEVTPKWEATLRPRYPKLFANLFDLAYRLGDVEMLGQLVGFAKWPDANADIDRTLSALTRYSHEHVRARAVEIAGWRLRLRNGPSDALREALNSREPLDQIYAAEGLALAGHADGLPVLRTAVDALDDWSLRERVVLAIGVLADESTVDMLLTMANDEMHAMQQPAAQAIGHMSASDRADEVFATLSRLANEDSEPALRGLRWFGTPGAWDILRRTALDDDNWWTAQIAVELLRYDEGSAAVIAQVLRENDDWDVAETAAESLRYVYGPDSLEPDYLLMQAAVTGTEPYEEALKRLREDGDTGRLLDTISLVHEDCVDEVVPQLVAMVLGRDPLPIDAAAERLSSDKPQIAAIAAQIVGRGGTAVAKKHGKALSAGAVAVRERWSTTWAEFLANRRGAREKLEALAPTYQRFVWALGQLEAGKDEVLAAADLPDHELTRPIREDAVSTLGEPWFGKDGVALLVKLASGGDARLRAMAAAELDRCAPKESAKLLAKSAHDDVSYGRLLHSLPAKDAQAALRSAVSEAAGVALPRLAALGDVEGLINAMRDEKLAETTRRGAIDALSTISSADVAKRLAEFGADEDQDELLRKAAWRARRRVTRAVAAQEAP